MIYYSWEEYDRDILTLKYATYKFDHVIAIYRGSLPIATHISNVFQIPLSIVGFQTRDGVDKEPYWIKQVCKVWPNLDQSENILIVDDIYDSGKTMKAVLDFVKPYAKETIKGFCLFGRQNDDSVIYCNENHGEWVEFPWERLEEDINPEAINQ